MILYVNVGNIWLPHLVIPLTIQVQPRLGGQEGLDVQQDTLHVPGRVPVCQLQNLHSCHSQHHAPLQPGSDHFH